MRKNRFLLVFNITMAFALTAGAVFCVPQEIGAEETEETAESESPVYQEIRFGTENRIELPQLPEDTEYTFVCEDERVELSEMKYDEENGITYIEVSLLEETDDEIELIIYAGEEEYERMILKMAAEESEEPEEELPAEENPELPSETGLDEYVAEEEAYNVSAETPVTVSIMYGAAYDNKEMNGDAVTSALIGTVLYLKADEDTEDSRFIEWSDGNTDPEREITVTDTLVMEAVFAERHQITAKDAAPSVPSAFAGDEITVTAKERIGYRFVSWEVSEGLEYTEDGMTIRFVMPDHDVNATAVYEMLKGTWAKKDGKWTYVFLDGTSPVSEWALIKDKYYLFDENGVMLTGWQKYNGHWYFLESYGAMKTGWHKSGSKWYYLKDSGEMAVGWVKVKGKWYYMNGSGAMTTGWQKVRDKWYWMDASGAMKTDWHKSGSKWYYLKDSGAMAVGWVKVKDKWYYMDASGAMMTGWQKVKDKWYWMDASGAMITGWRKISGKWYYLDPSGAMAKGWKKISGKWYLLNSSGAMLSGWQYSNGKWYYLNKAGDMATGWKRLKGEYYYLSESGVMLTGTQSIGGKTYQFKTNGAWKNGGYSDLKILFVDTQIKPQWRNLYNLFGKIGAKTYFLNTSDFDVNEYDALVLGGGGDVDPSFYGESNQGSRNIDKKEDELQMAAIRKFVEAGKPVFGVCRGEQVLNVYFGGSLHQDKSGHMGVYRAVTTAEGSLFEGTVANGYSAYHSHHQCVKELGSGLWATAYDAKDGLIEGFEHKSLPVFGVQYHPEAMGNCDAILKMFLKVVQAHKTGIRVN